MQTSMSPSVPQSSSWHACFCAWLWSEPVAGGLLGHGAQGCLDRAGLHKGGSMGMPGGTCVTREGALVSGTKMGKHTLCVGRCSLRPLYDPPSSTFSEAPAVVGSSSAEGLGQCPALPEYNLLVTLNITFNYTNSEHIHFKNSKCHIHG